MAVAALAGAGVGIADFSLGQPSLDEVFLALTGHTAEPQPDEDDEFATQEAAA
jgi:ABC-2 type transport system ATP-binding protein